MLARCRRPSAVAEVAAGLDLPVSVTKILLADLVGQGLHRPRAADGGPRGGRRRQEHARRRS
ncbi:DUF742 domain-containing protein [Streptomyces zhihengii]